MMRKYESKPNTRVQSQFTFNTKKKTSWAHHIPNISPKSNVSTPKSPLQFRSHSPLLPLYSNNNISKTLAKDQKNADKLPRKQKQNILKPKKLSQKPLNKEQLKFAQKKKIHQKVKQLQQKFSRMKSTKQTKPQLKDKVVLKSLVTQFQVNNNNMVNSYQPLKFQYKTNKSQAPFYVSALIKSFTSETSSVFCQLTKAHLATSLQLLEYTKKLSKPSKLKPSIKLSKTLKKTIVFDLDQTLVHCNDSIDKPYDVLLDIKFPNGQVSKGGINIRPYAVDCLRQLSKQYELIVFTASHSCYGNAVIDCLDPQKQYISHRFFRQSCHRTPQGMYIKDLRVVDRDLNNLLLVDNAAYSYCFQLQNGVPIVPFYNNKNDTQLKQLTRYLKQLSKSPNLKEDHCKILRTDKYNKFTDSMQLIKTLYSEYL